ncbi:MAG: hypothetical protein A3E37_00625 [Candidatus Andersenbacteria bacterium RIFCSPHIGHO2_12_FULL_46_9]|nr:MAG: hypothetical protein A3B76_02890 [Candidatus Andersenbacteria bacterium RIFCSPHIGHO2_02_FULL_46_16]OGY35366.1 MAG: hypothetical protein A3E37_00625 [Candidatus Andersenbacteria bacterium RIFCSPHIGHO2_12_FULL_46_9]OGY36218.1 MAG: hypothetical protein A3I08_05210 [Candidatus Andersenbacteria bacterium RIFCSPLOWO2_02_FULL_46_11]OGY39861.1 MAG: hypothetical protein A3G57_00825 [Candidatus Andersenbacteria bacterium RIFCSPLOWO2_12_FULL_45_8]HBE89871.1 hypothetical protein [Candidatus Anderse
MYYVATTTINKPTFIEEYINDFKMHGHEYMFVIAGDLKTPEEVKEYCSQFAGVTYLDVKAQLKEFKELAITKYIPFNSIDRRNFAYLFCIKQGLRSDDVLITLDDDNLLKETDFLSKHSSGVYRGKVVEAGSPTWYNALEPFYDEPIFMRGFSPFDREKNKERKVRRKQKKVKIAMNQGLWEQNPDVDAIERIKGLRGDYKVRRKERLVLGKNMICPLDTQNTAYLNSFWLTAFLCPFIGRFDDIYSSYISKFLADQFGLAVAYGSPVVTQHRNDHHNYQDFLLELQGMALTETLVDFLWSLDLKAKSLLGGYEEIAVRIDEEYSEFNLCAGKRGKVKNIWSLAQMSVGMKLWLEALDKLGVGDSGIVRVSKQRQPSKINARKSPYEMPQI